jgi:hypothetical protein
MGWAIVGIGLACGVVAALMLVSSVGSAVNDVFFRDPCATPCAGVRNLEKGNYLVFERVGSSSSVGPFSSRFQGRGTISRTDVTITSIGGRALEVGEPGTSQTIDRGGTIYAGVVSFHVPESGRYRVAVDAPAETRILVAPGFGQIFVKALPGLVVGGIGVVDGVVGLVLLILAWIHRRSADGAATYPLPR